MILPFLMSYALHVTINICIFTGTLVSFYVSYVTFLLMFFFFQAHDDDDDDDGSSEGIERQRASPRVSASGKSRQKSLLQSNDGTESCKSKHGVISTDGGDDADGRPEDGLNRTNVELPHEFEQPTLSVTVARSQKWVTAYDKRPYCYYCGMQLTHVQRHWFCKHASEREVLEIKACRDRNRKCMLVARLRNLGNHCHNVDVIRKGEGEILVTHRKSGSAEAANYVPCEHCYKYVLKRELWRHRCQFGKLQKGRVVHEAQMLLPAPSNTNPQVYQLLSEMKDGEVRSLAMLDGLILDYAKKLVEVRGMRSRADIRDKIRAVTRLLMLVRQEEGMQSASLKDCISPQHFSACLFAVRQLGGYDGQTGSYKTPSVVLKVGHALKKMTKIVKRQAIESRMSDLIRDIDNFHDLCVSEWGALDTVHRRSVGPRTGRIWTSTAWRCSMTRRSLRYWTG